MAIADPRKDEGFWCRHLFTNRRRCYVPKTWHCSLVHIKAHDGLCPRAHHEFVGSAGDELRSLMGFVDRGRRAQDAIDDIIADVRT